MKIRKGDTVIVITGKDKGKKGTVIETMPKVDRVIVEGVQVGTKHQKSRRRGSQGQILERAMPIHVSNVALVDGKSGKAARVGFSIEGEGKDAKKVRVLRPSGEKV